MAKKKKTIRLKGHTMSTPILNSETTYENIRETFEFSSTKHIEEAFTIESFNNDDSQLKSLAKDVSTVLKTDSESPAVRAGVMASLASLDYDATNEHFIENSKDIDQFMTVENFSSANPDDVQAYNFSFNYGASRQEPLLEAFFPTIVQAVGTRVVKISVDVDYLISQYNRLDGKPGSAKDKAVPFVEVINDTTNATDRNLLVPQSDRKVEWDQFFIKAIETEATDPVTGETIKTAPTVAGKDIVILDLGQSEAEASVGEFDQSTQIAPFPKINTLIFNVGAEYLGLDVEHDGKFTFSETATGDSKDIVLTAVGEVVVEPRGLTDILTGAPTTEFDDIPVNYKVIYNVSFHGDGNLRDGYYNVNCTKFEVNKIVDTVGIAVPDTATGYAEMLTAANKLATTSFKGQYVEARIVNDDLARQGRRLTLREKSQEHVLQPGTPITVEAPLKSMSGVNKTDEVYIPFLVKYALVDVNSNGINRLLNYANFLRNNVTNYVTPNGSFGITSWLVKPWFKSRALNLSTSVDSVRTGEREEDIKASFDINVKNLVSEMVTDSNYIEAVRGVKDSIDIAVGVHSSLGKFVGTTVDMGDGYNVRVYQTNKKQFKGSVIIAPANFSSTRNTEVDIFSLGAHFYTPVLIGEEGERKTRVMSAQVVDTHAIFLPLMAELTVTGLEDSLLKIAQNRRTV